MGWWGELSSGGFTHWPVIRSAGDIRRGQTVSLREVRESAPGTIMSEQDERWSCSLPGRSSRMGFNNDVRVRRRWMINAAASLFAGALPAGAQEPLLGTVVCVVGEFDSLPGPDPEPRVVRRDTEVVARVGAGPEGLEEAERDLRAELEPLGQVRCARSEPGHTHVVVVSYMGAVKEDLAVHPESPRFQIFAVGYGASWEAAEDSATTSNERFATYYDGSGYRLVMRETWGAGAAPAESPEDSPGGREGDPGTPAPVASGPLHPGTVFRDCSACPEMVVVPPGRFKMGSPFWEGGRYVDEWPQHEVTIDSAFAVGVYEVTFAEWDACADAGGCWGYRPEDHDQGRGRLPVIEVSWHDAQAYVRWLSRETGVPYRLPTEAEWEYAARARTWTARYWGEGYWGEGESWQCRYANGFDQALAGTDHGRRLLDFGAMDAAYPPRPATCSDDAMFLAPVGSFPANDFGLHDVLGNAWEWTEDCWNASHLDTPADGTARLSGDCSRRVLRGGAWNALPWHLRSAFRTELPAVQRGYDLGFRVARDVR